MESIKEMSLAEQSALIFEEFEAEAKRLEPEEPGTTHALVELGRAFQAIAWFQGLQDIPRAVELTLAISQRSGRDGLRIAPLAWYKGGRA